MPWLPDPGAGFALTQPDGGCLLQVQFAVVPVAAATVEPGPLVLVVEPALLGPLDGTLPLALPSLALEVEDLLSLTSGWLRLFTIEPTAPGP